MSIDYVAAGASGIAAASRHLGLSLAAVALLSSGHSALAQTVLPQNVKKTCVVSQVEFSSWFESGSNSINGGVFPADGLAFFADPVNPLFCTFYKWSQQMFLWLTSPVPSRYGTGSHVFDSPVFYAVSPPDSNNQRTLIPHTPGGPFSFMTNLSQRGSSGQEVVFDSTGKIHDVVRPEAAASGKLLARGKTGQPVEIERIQAGPNGKPVLLDKTDKPIDVQIAPGGAPLLRDKFGAAINLQPATVLINGIPHLVTTSGGVIETEQGQAGGAVLMAQNGSLVYYLIQVNDVYAYFKTGVAKGSAGGIPLPFTGAFTKFPNNPSDLAQITTFGFNNSKFLPDANAMAVEVKSAWIETTGLANPNDYVTITATVPNFTPALAPPFAQTTITQSVQSAGTRQTTLALVGMHVVGSVAGHPEMIWATFEHINNAPNVPYTYNTITGTTPVPGPADGPGPWNFSSTGASVGAIAPRMTLMPNGTIVAASQPTIGRSDIYRRTPWGTASTNPTVFAKNNTDIISINNSVFGSLITGDKRKKYMMTGTTWTPNGQNATSTNGVGTNSMANTTMETFFQPSNCFNCHSGNMLGSAPAANQAFSGGLSHIWQPLKQLFP
jgi:hypothetical protein